METNETPLSDVDKDNDKGDAEVDFDPARGTRETVPTVVSVGNIQGGDEKGGALEGKCTWAWGGEPRWGRYGSVTYCTCCGVCLLRSSTCSLCRVLSSHELARRPATDVAVASGTVKAWMGRSYASAKRVHCGQEAWRRGLGERRQTCHS